MENIKIRIKSRTHSAEVQNELFRLGCRWPDKETTVYNVEKEFLFTDQDGVLGHSDCTEVFESSSNAEVTLQYLRNEKWKNPGYYRIVSLDKQDYYYDRREEFIGKIMRKDKDGSWNHEHNIEEFCGFFNELAEGFEAIPADQCVAECAATSANITVINQLMSSLTREIMKHTENSENLKELRLAVAALSAIYELQIEINYNQ